MNIEMKISVLDRLYGIYDNFSAKMDYACQKYCSVCCTTDVTLTTLEAIKIIRHLQSTNRLDLLNKLDRETKGFRPKITINEMAKLCMSGQDLPEEEIITPKRKCPFLEKDACPIYDVRPFACRCLVSKDKCEAEGSANIDPLILTINTVFLQYIEHIDIGGFSGNLVDVLLSAKYESDPLTPLFDSGKLVRNHRLNILMIPPNHRKHLRPIIEAIQHIQV